MTGPVERVPLSALKPAPWNPRTIRDARFKALCASLTADPAFVERRPVLAMADGTIYAGNMRYRAATALGWTDIPALVEDVDERTAKERALRDNNQSGEWQQDDLAKLVYELGQDGSDLGALAFDTEEMARLLASVGIGDAGQAPGFLAWGDDPLAGVPGVVPVVTLADRFIVPPFSVLDARQGYWQARKRAWLALGIQSELGRGENALGESEGVNERHGEGEGPYAKGSRVNVTPGGGSPRDAASLGPDGKIQRGDGHGRAIPASGLARTFGQDLMRGEHTVGQRKPETASLKDGLTWPTSIHPYDATGQKRNEAAASFKSQGRLAALQKTGDSRVAMAPVNGVFGPAEDAGDTASQTGTSIFDPVLCELAYRWFCPPTGAVLDPFAGGSVRGIVASRLGRAYTGIDLRPEQLEANREQAGRICGPADVPPVWHAGDSTNLPELVDGAYRCDLVFSCPPYADLEVYSDDPRDVSTMAYPAFLAAYRGIVAQACAALKEDRFAVWVVGDVRGPDGAYRNLIGETVAAFKDAGLALYNEAVLVTAVGSLPIRVGRQFSAGRKLGKTHQNVLVFVKGNAKRATEACGLVEVAFPEDVNADLDTPTPVQSVDTAAALARAAAVPVAAAPTPVQSVAHGGGAVWLKRDDLFVVAGVSGGKVRTCWALALAGLAAGAGGLVTAGSRASPQVNMVAQIARALGVPCRVHTPTGALGPEVEAARAAGAEVVQHRAGYNNVIIARARADAAERGWAEIPFGMECAESVTQTRRQVPATLPEGCRRVVVPVGSGMSLAGVLWGLADHGLTPPDGVLGVRVGADPVGRLDAYAPPDWRSRCVLVESGTPYEAPARATLGGVALDAHYEAKCAPLLRSGDLFWIVGVRQSQMPTSLAGEHARAS